MKHRIETQIRIEASPKRVWETLMNLPGYSHWNPFIQHQKGNPQKGERLVLTIGGMTMKPKVTRVEPQQSFRWLGHLFIPGLFDGEHCFELKANPDQSTTFVQSENFNGVLVGLLKKKLDTDIIEGFEAMNEALKSEVEGGRRKA